MSQSKAKLAPVARNLKRGRYLSGATETYWNFEKTPARKCRVVVGKSEIPTWWCAKHEGKIREAVEVEYDGTKFYLDNADGSGWRKVTFGQGSPHYGHSSLPVERVLDYL